MPTLIKISSDPIWVFCFFIVFFLVFHMWLVYWKPIGSLGWKKVDYIWLSVAAVGLVGQCAQIRQHWYATEYDFSRYQIDGAFDQLKRQADFSISPAICRSFERTEYSPKNLDIIQTEYNFACTEFTKITKEVRFAAKERNAGFLELLDTSEFRKKLTNPILIKSLNNLDTAHQRFMDALEKRDKAHYMIKNTSAEFGLMVISPYLFMFALALRLAKVTGEIRLSKVQS